MNNLLDNRDRLVRRISQLTKEELFDFGEIKVFLNKYTLAPHYNTVKLADLAGDFINEETSVETIADVGTGSGFIAILLAKRFPSKKFYASDICPHCLRLAAASAKVNSLKNIDFVLNKDKVWLSEYQNQRLDLIVSNPPYVGEEEFYDKDFFKFCPTAKLEPVDALVTHGDKRGVTPFVEIVKNSRKNRTFGYVFMGNSLTLKTIKKKILQEVALRVSIIKDADNSDRFVLATAST